jgi:hypothetical protein
MTAHASGILHTLLHKVESLMTNPNEDVIGTIAEPKLSGDTAMPSVQGKTTQVT